MEDLLKGDINIGFSEIVVSAVPYAMKFAPDQYKTLEMRKRAG